MRAEASTVYANSSTGDDANLCTEVAPCKTFTRAYAAASDGDTIDLIGTFDWSNTDETGDTTSSYSGFVINKSLTIQGQGADQTIIQANSSLTTATSKRIFTVIGTNNVTIKKLTFRYGSYDYGATSYASALQYNGSSPGSLTILNCVFTENANPNRFGGAPIAATGSGKFAMRNSTVYNNNGLTSTYFGYTGGLYASSSDVEITNCTFYNNRGGYEGAIYAYGSSAKLTITNSTFVNNRGSSNAADIYAYSSATVYLKNNIFADSLGGPNLRSDGTGVFVDGGYNIIESQNSAGFTDGVNGNMVGDQASLNVDTGLATNSSTHGVPTLALLEGSVAINAGDPNDNANNGINVPVSDERYFYRNSRTDIGAFEYGGVSSFSRPDSQASNVNFSSVSYSQMTVSWTNGNGMRRAVFIKQAGSGTAEPSDNATYTANTTFGSGTQIGSTGWHCVYNGTGTSVTVSGLSLSTDYIAQVFEYSGNASEELYFTNTAINNPNTQATTAVTEPTTQASSLSFSSIGYTSMTASWSNGSGEKRAVFIKQAGSGTASPSDNSTYTANTTFGSGTQIESSGWYCVYNGTDTSVTVSGLTAETDYIFQIFEYNGTAGIENYFPDQATDNPKSQATATVSEPTTQAYNISFSSVGTTSMYLSWSSGNGSRRAVFAKASDSGTASPVDNINYTASTTLGSGTQIGTSGWYCVYNSTGSGTWVYGLSADTNYIFQVFEYNYSGSIYNYFTNTATSNPGVQMTAASQPTTQATAVSFSSVAATSLMASWTNGNGSARAVFIKQASSGTATPVDNTTYTANTAFGSGTQISTSGWYCIYNGSGTSVDITGLTMGTSYSIQVFEYNGTAGRENYYTSSATGNPGVQATPGNYTLTYAAGAHGLISGTSPQTVSPGADGAAVSAVPDEHYHFVNWSDSSTQNPRTDQNVNANVSVTANFSIDTYSLAYTAGAHGLISGTSPQTVGYNLSGTAVSAVPDAHYHFVEWSDSSTQNPRTDANLTANVSVSASFAIDTYTLTYAAGAHGSVSGATSQTVDYGSDGSAVTAVPASGYSFSKWSDDSTDNPRTDQNVTGNVSVTASFKDTRDPLISGVSAKASLSSVTVSWKTDEDSNSQVNYGFTSDLGSASDLDKDMETEHSIPVASLQSCATYYYQVTSEDADGNSATSETDTFATSGCESSSISEGGEGDSIDTGGGSITINTNDGTAKLEVPENFYLNGETPEGGTFQINKLSAAGSSGAPNGKSLVEDNFFDLLFISDSGSQISDFDEDITFTITYGSDTEEQYDENTLDLYKYADGEWTAKNCALDTSANTLTCTLPSFSTYGVFGEEIAEDSDDDDEEVEVKKVRYSSSANSITIKWKTDQEADSKVKYGLKKNNLKNKESDKDKEKKHEITLSNLKPATKYYFKVYSKDGDDNEDSSKIYSAITLSGTENADGSDNSNSNEDGKKESVLNSTPDYSDDAVPSACSYIVEEGDNLWSIAKKIYGDATAYPLIIEANKEKHPGVADLKLSIGQELVFENCKTGSVEGASDVKNADNESLDAQTENQSQEESHWWNPFSWF